MDNNKPDFNKLTQKQKIFAKEFVFDWNGARAARAAGYSEKTAKEIASNLLTNVNVAAYIEHIQKDLGKLAGISAYKSLVELMKIAFSSLQSYKDSWMGLKEWEEVSDDDKAAIVEVTYTTIKLNDDVTKEVVKFKLHDKQRALDSISKMLGYNVAEKRDIVVRDERKDVNDLFPGTDEITGKE